MKENIRRDRAGDYIIIWETSRTKKIGRERFTENMENSYRRNIRQELVGKEAKYGIRIKKTI